MSSLSCTQRTIKQGHHHLSDWKTITQEFSQLIEKNNAILSKEQSLESLKTDLSVLVSNYQALSIRLKKSERREQALIEELEVAQARLHSTYDATQDFQHRFDDQAQRVLKDPLTKVYNRTAFNNRLELEYHRWIRTQHPLRLVLFDIDHFKGINQKFGYSAGDKALRIIARTLLKIVSDTDTVARFAGEEFLIIMPERDEQSCYLLVQKIQRHIKELPFKFKEIELTITVSAVSVSFQENNTPEEVLERLYHQLLKSKSTEPNQITWQ
ncbi:GGDEF domain-containing protein [Vibrio sp. PP-XX7]